MCSLGLGAAAQELPPPVPGFTPPGGAPPAYPKSVPGSGYSTASLLQPGPAPAPNPAANARAGRFQIRLDPPGPETLFRLESERDLELRLEQEEADGVRDFEEFPELPTLSEQAYQPRQFEPRKLLIEPHFVNHGRLYFQDLSHERYGWDLGFVTPLFSAARFYKDVVFLPHNYAARPQARWESSAGYCLPGEPVPYMMYPPEISPLGVLAQGGTVLGLAGIFP